LSGVQRLVECASFQREREQKFSRRKNDEASKTRERGRILKRANYEKESN